MLKQLDITPDDNNIIEYMRIILLQLSVFTTTTSSSRDNKTTLLSTQEETHYQHGQYLIHTNNITWNFVQENELE